MPFDHDCFDAKISFNGINERDVRIRFTGSSGTVLIRNNFDAQGKGSIVRISFADAQSGPQVRLGLH